MISGVYTVRELAELSGVSVRTLHHYDDLGLVCPRRAANNYRVYGPAEVDRLQQVLLYREAEMSLDSIKRLLDDPVFDAASALTSHLRELRCRQQRVEKLIASVKKTLAHMKGGPSMKDKEKFEAFKKNLVEENERTYGTEVREKWGSEATVASNAKVMGMSEEQYAHSKELEQQIAEAILAGIAADGPAGEDGQRGADLHRQWLCMFWKEGTYSSDAHVSLAEGYVVDERFRAYYEAIAPGATEFLRDAIKAYCA